MKDPDTVGGAAAAAVGGGGLTLQWIIGYADLLVTGVNAVLALLGIWLMLMRIRKERKKDK